MVKFTCIQKRYVNLLAGAPLRPEIHVAEIRSPTLGANVAGET